jgi:hypothetical protein
MLRSTSPSPGGTAFLGGSVSFRFEGLVTTEPVGHQPVTAEALFRTHSRPCMTCGSHSATGTRRVTELQFSVVTVIPRQSGTSFSTCALQPSRLIVRSGLDVPTFATRRLHACHHASSTQRRKVKLWARNVQTFCLNSDFHVTFRDLFTCRKATTWDRRLYFPSEGRCAENFFRPKKIRRLRPGANPRTWVPKASTLPLDHRSCLEVLKYAKAEAFW